MQVTQAVCALALAGLICLTATGQPDSTIPEDIRSKAVAAWRKAYDTQTDAIKNEISKAKKDLSTFSANRTGRDYQNAAKRLATWEAEASRVKKEPFCPTPRAGVPQLGNSRDIGGNNAKVGAFGNLASPQGKVLSKNRDGAMLVEVTFKSAALDRGTVRPGTRIERFLIGGPRPPGANTGQTVRLPDLYYVARMEEVGGNEIPLLVPIEVRPDEMPTELAAELEKKRKK